MRLWAGLGLVLCAFAANSVLNRLALAGGASGPGAFAAVRLVSGALALNLLALGSTKPAGRSAGQRLTAPVALLVYMIGFSYAYVTLPAGVGALILFGVVQVTMFGGAVIRREPIPPQRWIGALVAFGGLVGLLWPGSGGSAVPAAGGAMMIAAGLGWGVYSLAGRRERDPLRATAANFLLAAPVAVALVLLHPDQQGPSLAGVIYGVVAGVVTSGLGYALWYRLLPQVPASVAAVAQLLVPVLAAGAGAVLLAEAPSARQLVAGFVVLAGVGFAATGGPGQGKRARSG